MKSDLQRAGCNKETYLLLNYLYAKEKDFKKVEFFIIFYCIILQMWEGVLYLFCLIGNLIWLFKWDGI